MRAGARNRPCTLCLFRRRRNTSGTSTICTGSAIGTGFVALAAMIGIRLQIHAEIIAAFGQSLVIARTVHVFAMKSRTTGISAATAMLVVRIEIDAHAIALMIIITRRRSILADAVITRLTFAAGMSAVTAMFAV